jgi:hypothetical protein
MMSAPMPRKLTRPLADDDDEDDDDGVDLELEAGGEDDELDIDGAEQFAAEEFLGDCGFAEGAADIDARGFRVRDILCASVGLYGQHGDGDQIIDVRLRQIRRELRHQRPSRDHRR